MDTEESICGKEEHDEPCPPPHQGSRKKNAICGKEEGESCTVLRPHQRLCKVEGESCTSPPPHDLASIYCKVCKVGGESCTSLPPHDLASIYKVEGESCTPGPHDLRKVEGESCTSPRPHDLSSIYCKLEGESCTSPLPHDLISIQGKIEEGTFRLSHADLTQVKTGTSGRPIIYRPFSQEEVIPDSLSFENGIWTERGGIIIEGGILYEVPNIEERSWTQPGWTSDSSQENRGLIRTKIDTLISPIKLSKYKGAQMVKDPFIRFVCSLPGELMVAIFACLPAKSLARFRCVSKSLYFLVSHFLFVKMHYDHWSKLERVATLMLGRDTASQIGTINPEGGSFKWEPMGIHEHDNLDFVGLSKGLICLTPKRHSRHGCDFLVINPSLKQSIVTRTKKAPGKNDPASLGFGWDEKGREFKIVKVERLLVSGLRRTILSIYSLYGDSWKEVIYSISTNSLSLKAVYLCGYLYWISNSGKLFTIFNLRSEMLYNIPVPGPVESRCSQIYLLDQNSMAAIIYDPEDGNDWTWLAYPIEDPDNPENPCVWKKHDVYFSDESNDDYPEIMGELARQSPQFKNVMPIGHYTESLVPVKKVSRFFRYSLRRLEDSFWRRCIDTIL